MSKMEDKNQQNQRKRRKWLESFGTVDESFVAEADPAKVQKKPFRLKTFIAVAACLCMVLTGGGLYLFLPLKHKTPDVSEHRGSEYYELIEKMNALYATTGVKYKNNFDKLTASFGSIFPTKNDVALEDGTVMDTGMPERGEDFLGSQVSGTAGDPNESAPDGDSYQEVTDNQVAGVTEADRIKRTKDHIFYMYDRTLEIFSIAGEKSEKVGSYEITNMNFRYTYAMSWEFYLSKDGKTVTVIAPYASNSKTFSGTSRVAVIALDVSDPTAIVEKSTASVTGTYLSSRVRDGKLLLVSRYSPSRGEIDFEDAATFVPQIDCGDGAECIPAEDIVAPDELTHTSYTVLTMFDENGLGVIDTAALLSYSSEMYVSEQHMFIARPFTEKTANGEQKYQKMMNEIYCMAYGDEGFAEHGSVVVEGSIKDQYSMDEFEGVLRIVTTSEENTYEEYANGYVAMDWQTRTNANLYCFDLSSGKLLASAIAFAPEGERVQSVRFDGDAAYVCTSVQLSDPVFFFDLSDLPNITWKDTGTIEGFSSSLVNFGDGYLLGIGRGDSWTTVKIEIYEEGVDGVISVCSYERENASISDFYKAYYIDREERLVGMGVALYGESPARYLVLYFDGNELIELIFTPKLGDVSAQRGVYIDGFYYILGQDGLSVVKLGN